MACTIFRLVGSPELWQWDTGRQLSVTDPAGVEIHKVHFGNGDTQTAPAVDVDRDTMTVNIPNSLLQRSGQIRVYAMNQTGNSEVTIHSHKSSILSFSDCNMRDFPRNVCEKIFHLKTLCSKLYTKPNSRL